MQVQPFLIQRSKQDLRTLLKVLRPQTNERCTPEDRNTLQAELYSHSSFPDGDYWKTISVRGWHQRRDSFTWEMQCCLVQALWCALCPDHPWEPQGWAHSQALPTDPHRGLPSLRNWGMVETGTHQCCSMCLDAPAPSLNGRKKEQQLCRNTTISLGYWVHSHFSSTKIQALPPVGKDTSSSCTHPLPPLIALSSWKILTVLKAPLANHSTPVLRPG